MRIVPIGKEAIQALRKWIKSRSQLKNVANNSVLFLTKQTKKLSQRAVQYRLKFWAKKQGISENIHPHLLRHSFASHLLQSSQDLRAVQEMLGHESITTTEIYTHLDRNFLRDTLNRFHPGFKNK